MPAELDIVATENRRLVREVKDLRARVTALESSRWWRLHPRFVLRRLVARGGAARSDDRAAAPAQQIRFVADDSLSERFRDEVVARGSFRADLVSGNFSRWEPVLKELEGREARILEIGSFEGMSACYFLWRLPDARVTCIDTFGGGASFAALGQDVSGLEDAFDRNVSLVDAAHASGSSSATQRTTCRSSFATRSNSISSSSTAPILRSTCSSMLRSPGSCSRRVG